MKLQQQSRHGFEEFTEGTDNLKILEFPTGKKSQSHITLIFIEAKTSPASI